MSRLPPLTAKGRNKSPFRDVVLSPTSDDLIQQALRDPNAGPYLRAGKSILAVPDPGLGNDKPEPHRPRSRVGTGRHDRTASAADGEFARLQVRVPKELAIAFRIHCLQNRTTVNAEPLRFIERTLHDAG